MSHPNRPRLLRLTCAIATIAALVATGCAKKPPPQTAKSEPRFPALTPKEVPEFLKGTITERVYIANTGPKPVSGYGLVAPYALAFQALSKMCAGFGNPGKVPWPW